MQDRHNVGKVLLALDISPRSRAALETAAALAGELDVELAGLFVEDINLLRLSELSFTREIGTFSNVSRPIGLEQVEQALRREADEVQRLLAETAARLRLRWSFHVRRGQIATELFAQAGEFDLVVLGKRARLGLRPFDEEMAGVERRLKDSSPVLAVFDGSASAHRALELALRLAEAIGAELRLLVPAATDDAFSRHVTEANALLAHAGINPPTCRRIAKAGVELLATVAREEDCGVLVLNSDGQLRRPEGFATLLNEIDCPVVLVL
ncbi:MAG: hypothetical protein A3B82_06020 [Methylophilales bacterium RIFCSPHIGHO2_02_FULL_57_10]|nr:MAG: hypothetical protein A3B82_06020 [Methylophilales bacterium RIFCSPHIGHO2_02_FULL_57_10]